MKIDALHVVGAGSLGSFSALLLSKELSVLSCPLKVYDFDIVEEHNIDNQLYRTQDVGKPKVKALGEILKDLNGVDIDSREIKVKSGSDFRGIPIVLIDNMKGRRDIFLSCRYDSAIPYYIEARTGNNTALVYAFNPRFKDWVDRYEKTLYSDNEVPDRACANRETVPSLWAVASVISGILVQLKSQKIFRNEFIEIGINFGHWPIVRSKVSEEL